MHNNYISNRYSSDSVILIKVTMGISQLDQVLVSPSFPKMVQNVAQVTAKKLLFSGDFTKRLMH